MAAQGLLDERIGLRSGDSLLEGTRQRLYVPLRQNGLVQVIDVLLDGRRRVLSFRHRPARQPGPPRRLGRGCMPGQGTAAPPGGLWVVRGDPRHTDEAERFTRPQETYTGAS